jgi:signal transduction histidine kinase
MRNLNAHLEARVAERTAELEAQIAETRELEKSILEISDRERAAIGQDLHDGLCQQLVGAAFSANLLREKLTEIPDSPAVDADRIADLIDESITQARNLARGLYPVRLATEGLEMVLHELASTTSHRFDLECAVECPQPLPACGTNKGIQLYRIAQEAVTNAAKHSGCSRVLVTLVIAGQLFRMTIEDNGHGMAAGLKNPSGMGLSIMEYRARMIGARFSLDTIHGGGTRVLCEMDLKTFTTDAHE